MGTALEALARAGVGAQFIASAGVGDNAAGVMNAAPTTTPASDPLYRRAFVGREAELRQLHAAFDAAISGQGGLGMVGGGPGIGKTSMMEQLATYVALRGGKALVGHCYEEGSLSQPYLPFVEAMRSYVLAREPDGLKADLGTGAGDIARIVSEVRDRVGAIHESPSPGDPEEQRWRLLQAVSGFLRNASLVTPLLVVLEDLHDADRGTLDLLVHLSRNLQGARLLIVGTYRDVEVDRQHPLSSTLADLRRNNTFLRVPLRGLTVDEGHRLYTALRGHEVSWAQAEAVHRQTEGNPLFIQEVLRYLVEAGMVVRQGDRYVPQIDPGEAIPEGLRDVIGKRLSRLSDQTNHVLSIAAVIGREFRLDVLQRVAGASEDEVIVALEQATERAVVEVRSGLGANVGYRFAHAFFRQTLYEELSPPRRIRMHQQVARALEAVYGRRVEEHAAELAEHYSYSSDHADLAKAVEYGELAAGRAMAVFAYGEAVRHLERALEVQEVLDPDAKARRCDLLLALGASIVPTAEQDRMFEQIAPEAFALAVELRDRDRQFKVCRLVLDQHWGIRGVNGQQWLANNIWSERASQIALPGTSEQAFAEFYRGVALRESQPVVGAALIKSSYELARDLGDDEALLAPAGWLVAAVFSPVEDYAWLRGVADALEGRQTHDYGTLNWGFRLNAMGELFLAWGDRGRAEKTFVELRLAAERTRHPELDAMAAGCEALLACLDGEFDSALELTQSYAARATAAGRSGIGQIERMKRRPLMYRGRMADALNGLPPPGPLLAVGGVMEAQRAFLLALTGEREQSWGILDRFLTIPEILDPDGPAALTVLRYLLEAATASAHVEMCRAIYKRMSILSGVIVCEAWMATCIGRQLGAAAVLLSEREEARGFYLQAIETCENIRHRPELALTRLQLAELLLDHYPAERAEAIEHLDFAIRECGDMKMQPSLERALRRRELLQA